MQTKTYNIDVKISIYVPTDKGFYILKQFEEMAHGTDELKASLARGFNEVLQYIDKQVDKEDAQT